MINEFLLGVSIALDLGANIALDLQPAEACGAFANSQGVVGIVQRHGREQRTERLQRLILSWRRATVGHVADHEAARV